MIISLFYSNLIPSITFTNPGIFTGSKDTFMGHYCACHTSYDFCSLRLLRATCRSRHFTHSVLFDPGAPRQAEFSDGPREFCPLVYRSYIIPSSGVWAGLVNVTLVLGFCNKAKVMGLLAP